MRAVLKPRHGVPPIHRARSNGVISVYEEARSSALRRALISVYDKTNLAEFARGLHEAGVKLVSTGSTASTIAAAGVPVTEVTEVTDFPECLEGV